MREIWTSSFFERPASRCATMKFSVMYPGKYAGSSELIVTHRHLSSIVLIAAALVLSRLATEKKGLSGLVETLPTYYTIKSKARLPTDFKKRLAKFEKNDAGRLLGPSRVDSRDGLRFDYDRGWLQIRSSNTEPIFRLIVETDDAALSQALSRKVMGHFK